MKMMFFLDERNYGTSYLDVHQGTMATMVGIETRNVSQRLHPRDILSYRRCLPVATGRDRETGRPGREPRDVRSSGPRNSVIR